MKNKLMDLNNHLFAQLELLGDEDIKGEKLVQEIERAKAISGIADRIVANAKLSLDAHKAINEGHTKSAPAMIGIKSDE